MKTRRIKCEYCGRKFETDAPNAKYCSPICRDNAKKQGRKLWEAKHPFYNAEYFKTVTQRKAN